MSRRLAFQTQLASIMEVLANAAVAEICKLVDDDYAVVSFQMSQCQRENKALKRKLHLLELKLARGNAERRHRDNAGNSIRGAGHRVAAEPLPESLPPAGDVFSQHIEEALWSARSIEDDPSVPLLPDNINALSPDVELVEPEASLVKEENLEENMVLDGDEEEGLRLIGDDGVLECAPAGAAALKLDPEQKDSLSHCKSNTAKPTSRGVEKEDDDPRVTLVKLEEAEPMMRTRRQMRLSIQEGVVASSTDDHSGSLLLEESTQSSSDHPSDLQESGRGFSEVSYGHSSLWTNSGGCYSDDLRGLFPQGPPLSYNPGPLIGAEPGSSDKGLAAEDSAQPTLALQSSHSFLSEQPIALIDLSDESNQPSPGTAGPRAAMGPTRKLCTCSFCGKGFRAPANLESHMRTHTGEKPYGCIVCGKRFSQFWNLKIHRNIHTGERPYECALCSERFSDPSNLKKHQKRHHPLGCPPTS